jgi:hypothetical protein
MGLDVADLPTRRLLVRRLTMDDLESCHRRYRPLSPEQLERESLFEERRRDAR